MAETAVDISFMFIYIINSIIYKYVQFRFLVAAFKFRTKSVGSTQKDRIKLQLLENCL